MGWWSPFLFLSPQVAAFGAVGITAAWMLLGSMLPKMPRLPSVRNRTVLITGGSEGLGLEMAKQMLEWQAHHVVIMSRNEEKLTRAKKLLDSKRRFASQIVSTLQCDVTDTAAVIETLKKFKEQGKEEKDEKKDKAEPKGEQMTEISVVVNCAGVAICDKLENLTAEDINQMMSLNVVAPINLTRHFLTTFKERKDGIFIYISSQGGQVGLYGFSGYSASKFALQGFTQSLDMELRQFEMESKIPPNSIRTLTVYPPSIDTPGFKLENTRKPKITAAIEGTTKLASAEKVASDVIEGLHYGQNKISFGLDGQMLSVLTAGFSPIDSPFQLLMEMTCWPIARLVSVGLLWYWQNFTMKSSL